MRARGCAHWDRRSICARRPNVATPLVPPSITVGTPVATPTRSACRQKSPRPTITCTCRSIRPGVTIAPLTSMTVASGGAEQSRPTAAMRASCTTTSHASSRPAAGSTTRPPRNTSAVTTPTIRPRLLRAHYLSPWMRALIAPVPAQHLLFAGDCNPAAFDDDAGRARPCGARRAVRNAATPRPDRSVRRRTRSLRGASTRDRRPRPRTAHRSRRCARGTRHRRESRSRARRARTSPSGRRAAGPTAAHCGPPSTATPSRSTPSHRIPAPPARLRPGSPRTGAIPPPPISMFELGQCATPVPQLPSRPISTSFG